MLSELVSPYQGQRIVYGISSWSTIARSSNEIEPSDQYFARLANQSDIIIRGEITNRTSQLTEDGKFLFTAYEVRIEEVLKNNPIAPIDSNSTITVTDPGGAVVIGDVIVKTSGDDVPSLVKTTHHVLLFAKAVPPTGDYTLARYDGGFEVDGGSVRSLTGNVPLSYLENSQSFLAAIRAVATK